MKLTDHDILITDRDMQRLLPVIAQRDAATHRLEAELRRAIVVAHRDVPPDVVTMNSEVVYQDALAGHPRTVRIVYPGDADPVAGRISVLSPIGTALLGLRVGQEIEWELLTGIRRIRVVEMCYQPEAAGDLGR